MEGNRRKSKEIEGNREKLKEMNEMINIVNRI